MRRLCQPLPAILTLIVLLAAQSAIASRAYVTDTFRISLRRGPSIENKILRFLPSTLPVEILETADGWAKVRTIEPEATQITGWVLSRYLIHRLPFEEQTKLLSAENKELKADLSQTQAARTTADSQLETLRISLQKAQKELHSANRNFSRLEKESKGFIALKEEFEAQSREQERLRAENILLQKENRHQWLAIGGGLVFGGLFFGFLFGRREKRRKSGGLYR